MGTEDMRFVEFLAQCSALLDGYFAEHTQELYDEIVCAANDGDSIETATWKMAIQSARYASKISMFAVLSILRNSGLIHFADDGESPPPPLSWVPPS